MDERLIHAARQAQANAYAPYSGYTVGVALETANGDVFTGANVENASFGLANCAERVALGAAVTAGARRFTRLVIVTHSEPPPAPCGACRQALAEFGSDLIVESVGPSETRVWQLGQLLPDAFGGEYLES
ncbi:MAG: cytidine deaminase [Gemmatimonadota bacterium]|nr:MAG: cytidine deaminase [Gemmatimonadota bacterium]